VLVHAYRPSLSPAGFDLLLRKLTERVLSCLEALLFFGKGGGRGGGGSSSSSSFGGAGRGGLGGDDGIGTDGEHGRVSQFGALKLSHDLRLFMVRNVTRFGSCAEIARVVACMCEAAASVRSSVNEHA
jgi:hypothetical protein